MRGYLRQGLAPLLGVIELRRRRGAESVLVGRVADQLVDYARRHPEDGLTIDRLARFLVGVDRSRSELAPEPIPIRLPRPAR